MLYDTLHHNSTLELFIAVNIISGNYVLNRFAYNALLASATFSFKTLAKIQE